MPALQHSYWEDQPAVSIILFCAQNVPRWGKYVISDIAFSLHSISRRKGDLSIPLFRMGKLRYRVVKFIAQQHLTQPHLKSILPQTPVVTQPPLGREGSGSNAWQQKTLQPLVPSPKLSPSPRQPLPVMDGTLHITQG